MDDMTGFEQDLNRLAGAVEQMQRRLAAMRAAGATGAKGQVTVKSPSEGDSGAFLLRRQQVLKSLGIPQKVSRAAWSHDNGQAIIFDAWQERWDFDQSGQLTRYPMRTKRSYSLKEARENPRRGHTRWQHHVEMVLEGQREAIAILPVRADPDVPESRTRGWLPQYVTGEIREDREGEFWFFAEKVVPV